MTENDLPSLITFSLLGSTLPTVWLIEVPAVRKRLTLQRYAGLSESYSLFLALCHQNKLRNWLKNEYLVVKKEMTFFDY